MHVAGTYSAWSVEIIGLRCSKVSSRPQRSIRRPSSPLHFGHFVDVAYHWSQHWRQPNSDLQQMETTGLLVAPGEITCYAWYDSGSMQWCASSTSRPFAWNNELLAISWITTVVHVTVAELRGNSKLLTQLKADACKDRNSCWHKFSRGIPADDWVTLPTLWHAHLYLYNVSQFACET